MKKILQIDGKSKVRKARVVEVKGLKEYGALEFDSRVALIQELIPIGLMHVAEELKMEVERLAGERYKIWVEWGKGRRRWLPDAV